MLFFFVCSLFCSKSSEDSVGGDEDVGPASPSPKTSRQGSLREKTTPIFSRKFSAPPLPSKPPDGLSDSGDLKRAVLSSDKRGDSGDIKKALLSSDKKSPTSKERRESEEGARPVSTSGLKEKRDSKDRRESFLKRGSKNDRRRSATEIREQRTATASPKNVVAVTEEENSELVEPIPIPSRDNNNSITYAKKPPESILSPRAMVAPVDGERLWATFRGSSSGGEVRPLSPEAVISPRSAWGEACIYMSKNFLEQVLAYACNDIVLDEVKIEGIVRAVCLLLEERQQLGEFIMQLAVSDYKGDCNCWRERTPLILVHHAVTDCPTSSGYLQDACKGLFKSIQWGGGGWSVTVGELLESLHSSMDKLPSSQRWIMHAAYEASGQKPRALTLIFFLRFVLPYLTHPRHGHPAGSMTWPVKILSSIGGSEMSDILSWPTDIRELCDRWRARMTMEDFFQACKEPYVPQKSLRGNVSGLKDGLIKFVRPNLSKFKEDSETQRQHLADLMVVELLKEKEALKMEAALN